MTSKLFGIYDPNHMDMKALDMLIIKWLRRRGKRVFPQLLDSNKYSPEFRVNYQFGYGDVARFEKQSFDIFYDETRIKFFLDESKSTYRDAMYELQPAMLKYFYDAMDAHFVPPGYAKPVIIDIDEEWWQIWLQSNKSITDEEAANLLALAQQNFSDEQNLEIAGRERLRKSKRLCVLQKTNSATGAKKRKLHDESFDEKDDLIFNPVRKPRKNNFNSVQWKHLQVQARKQLHEAVLSFDFAFVKMIASEWEKESEQERRLDSDAIEWAFRRICKQLLPHSAEKEILMRQNGIKMIETLFDCFKSMNLCKSNCMRLHIIGICRSLDNRQDILTHMMQYRCSCCLSLQI